MSGEQKEAAARALFEHATRGEYEAFETLVGPGYVCHSGTEDHVGPAGLAAMVEGYRRALGGLRVSIQHQFSAGDFVATRFTVHGRHEGELMGAAPTGRDIAFGGITVSRFQDGRIAEEWEVSDGLELLRQVGLLPAPAAT